MTISAQDLALYAGALVILFITPGPVWLALIARALSGGFRAAWPLAVGVAVGDILWPLVAVLGIAWVLSVFDTFMTVLRWVACGMFLIMGAMLIRHAGNAIDGNSRLTRPGIRAGFLAGVAVILSNPKAVLFYMGVLPGFFDLREVTAPDMAAIAAVSFVVPLAGNLLLAAFVGRTQALVTQSETRRRVNVVSGGALILVGVLIPVL